jgi:hypothetical protein
MNPAKVAEIVAGKDKKSPSKDKKSKARKK